MYFSLKMSLMKLLVALFCIPAIYGEQTSTGFPADVTANTTEAITLPFNMFSAWNASSGEDVQNTTELVNVHKGEELSTIASDVIEPTPVPRSVENLTEVVNKTEEVEMSRPRRLVRTSGTTEVSVTEGSSTIGVTNATESRVARAVEATTEVNNATEVGNATESAVVAGNATESALIAGNATESTVIAGNATESALAAGNATEPAVTAGNATEFAVPGNTTESAVDVGNATESGNVTCKAQALCYKDKDCGEKGRCLGGFVGKCNCRACSMWLTCSDDSGCGGLRKACNTSTKRCDCFAGYKANGFPLFGDALREFCNIKDCDANSDTCFGLPCNSGRCVC